jgi:competence protein ComEC
VVPVVQGRGTPVWRPVRPALIVGITVAVLGAYAWGIRPAPAPPHLRLHVFSVGDGLAALVRGPGGQNLLYDCGSLSRSVPGEAIVVPALRALGIRRIDTVVLSHPNLDHYNGLIDLARAVPVGRVCLTQQFLDAGAEGGLPGKLLADLELLGIPIGEVAAGDGLDSLAPAVVEVLWPPGGAEAASLDTNDASMVLRIALGMREVLLTGDITQGPQKSLMAGSAEAMRADVLLLPHHGSRATLDPAFVEAVRPEISIASTGAPARLPAATGASTWSGGVLEPVEGKGVMVDTDTCGMITVDLSPDRMVVETFRSSPVGGTVR